MNDDFEQHLKRQPLRQIPSAWRGEILGRAGSRHHSPFVIRHSLLSTLLWPHPKAWAGLAATWIVIAAIQFASSDRTENFAKKPEPPSPETMVVLQQQNHLLAELFEQSSPRDADRPKHNLNQPRSERRINALFA